MIKISNLKNGYFQVGNDEVPVDEPTLKALVGAVTGWEGSEVDRWFQTLATSEKVDLQTKFADIGTVVNIYEVEYPTPRDPNKATQELAGRVDEYKDFMSQQVFPDTPSSDVIVKTRAQEQMERGKPSTGPGKPKALAPSVQTSRLKGWRNVLG